MAEPTPSEIRARLRAAGIDVPARGRISGEHMDAYNELAALDEGAAVTAAGAPEAPEAEPPAAEGGAAVEVRPTRPKPERPLSLIDDLRSLAGKPPRARRSRPRAPRAGRGRARPRARPAARPARERVSIAPLIEMAWVGMARASAPISDYVAKCLAYESPVAGVILEERIRGTIFDRALQPLARGRAAVTEVSALIELPAAIAGLQAAEGLSEGRRALYRAGLIPLAVHGAVLQVKVIGPRLQEIIEREQEQSQVMRQAVELLLSMNLPFLTPDDLGVTVVPAEAGGDEAAPVMPEDVRDAAARAAQSFATG